MLIRKKKLVVIVLLGMVAAPAFGQVSDPLLLPEPASIERLEGSFTLKGATIAAVDKGERAAAGRLADLLRKSGYQAPRIARKGAIHFVRDPAVAGGEAYRLEVLPGKVIISASSDAGLFYGAQTLWQLAGIHKGRLPTLRIADKPAYAWRGVMLDSARHMQSAAFIHELIDRMAQVKLNKLHWHLTDDQGWRLPVPGYPRLTSIGGLRQPAGAEGIDPRTGKPRLYGGHYTEAEIRAIVAHAARLHIEIIPEIDVPGHGTAAISAYPWLASAPNPPSAPSADWGIIPHLILPNANGQKFVEDVLDQVFKLFPGRYVHIGGDEAVKDQWNANPEVQAQIRELGLKDANALQAWFVGRIADYVARHDRRVVGWDEILDGPVPPGGVVMSWRGASGAIKAAGAGIDTVLAPAPDYYLDNRQSKSDAEPSGRGPVVGWRRVFEYDPGIAALEPAARDRVLGMQVNLWTEHVRTEDYARSMLWPRANILAERAWTGRKGSWPEFAPRLLAHVKRARDMGHASNEISLEPVADFAENDSQGLNVLLNQPAEIGKIRYTLDGSVPGQQSPAYERPFDLAAGTMLRTQSFADDGSAISRERQWRIAPELARTKAGNDMTACTRGIELRMEDDAPTAGVRRVHQADIMNTCWIWRGVKLDGLSKFEAEVGTRPFNFSLGSDVSHVKFEPGLAAIAELRIQIDSCEGPTVATISLDQLAGKQGISAIAGSFDTPVAGRHDLCIRLVRKTIDPMWVLDRLTLLP